MRALVSLGTLLPLGILLLAGPSQAQDATEVEDAVVQHYAAISAGDMDAVASHHTAHFTGFLFGDGLLQSLGSHDEQMEVFSAAHAAGLQINMQVRHLEVRVFGNTAVAMFYSVGAVTWPNGTVQEGTWRVSEVWVREDGRWLEAHHHDGPLSP